MAKADIEFIKELEARINDAADGLAKVTMKRMFACHALFANANVFGLVWKEGRIGVKLTDAAEFADLMAQDGAGPWKAGNMSMSHWVLVPEAMHDDKRSLRKWLKVAHRLAMATSEASTASSKKGAVRKTSKKKNQSSAK